MVVGCVVVSPDIHGGCVGCSWVEHCETSALVCCCGVLVDGVLVCGVWVWAGTLLGCGRTGPHTLVCGCCLFPLPRIVIPVLGVVVWVCGGCLFCE